MAAFGKTARFFLLFVWGCASHTVFAQVMTPTPDSLPFVSGDQFKNLVDQSKMPVVLDFCATWCEPCQAYSPVVEAVSKSFAGKMAFYKVDVSDDDNEQRVHRYSVLSMPTLLIIEKGQVVERWEGALKLKDLEAKLDQVLKTWLKVSASN